MSSAQELAVGIANRQPEESANGVVAVDSVGINADIGWLSDLYALNDGALADLGFSEKQRAKYVPAFEQVRDAITPASAAWLNEQRDAGHQGELVIPPSVRGIGLLGRNRKTGLLPRFDLKQNPDGHKTAVFGTPNKNESWDKHPIHDNGQSGAFQAAMLLGDTTDPRPRHKAKAANLYNQAGLVFTDLRVIDQRKALKAERAIHEQAGRTLIEATIGQIILANAQRRLAGERMLDQWLTYTRLVHYPIIKYPKTNHPMIFGFNTLLRPRLTLVGTGKDPSQGVRRSLVIPIPVE
jgi:hypothetical protein